MLAYVGGGGWCLASAGVGTVVVLEVPDHHLPTNVVDRAMGDGYGRGRRRILLGRIGHVDRGVVDRAATEGDVLEPVANG